MEYNQITKQAIDFQKSIFMSGYNAMTMVQDQFERVAKTALEQATWLPAEGRQAIEKGTETYKSACQIFKQQVDDSYKQVEKAFVN